LQRKIEAEAIQRGRFARAEELSELSTPHAIGRLAVDIVIIGSQVEAELQEFQDDLDRAGLIAEF